MNIPPTQPKLEEQLRGVMRLKQYSRRTEEGYVQWYKRYVVFQSQVTGRMRHPGELGTEEVPGFLTHLAPAAV
ncbi:MAG: phage integrase N-terminal SAM-like domain-containing protein [Prosthecobacter sp.]